MHAFTLGTEKVSLARSRYFHAIFHWKDFAEIIDFFAVTCHRREAFGSSTFFGNRCARKYKAQRDALSASCTSSDITLLAESFEVGLKCSLWLWLFPQFLFPHFLRRRQFSSYFERRTGIVWSIKTPLYSLPLATPSWITTEDKILQFSVRRLGSQIDALGNLPVRSER